MKATLHPPSRQTIAPLRASFFLRGTSRIEKRPSSVVPVDSLIGASAAWTSPELLATPTR
jgi:hypothetical protein